MLNRPLKIALMICAAWFCQPAGAGELTLYAGADFVGRELTLRDATPNLRALGFPDRAASLVVRSGRWELCVGAAFRGDCAIFGRGEYRKLDRFASAVSSAREVGTGLNPNNWRGDANGRGMIELFAGAALQGNSTRLGRDMSDLVQIGFNNRAVSVQVESGTWQLCSEAGYLGECRVFAPGRHNDLGAALAHKLSSARMMPDGVRPAPVSMGARPARADGDIELFGAHDFAGTRVALARDVHTLREIDFNDSIGSIIVHNGQWEFCVNPDFRGQCVVYGPGRYTHLGSLDKAISSLRRVR
jgi:hypothetical protein